MNTIDNSTYLKISDHQGIYHVEAPSISLENVTINDLIEASLFDFGLKSITSFSLYKKNSHTDLQFSAELKNGGWVSTDNRPLDPVKLDDFLSEFSNMKSSHTLDKQSEAQEKQTQALLNNPEYTIKIKKNEEIVTYQISKSINSLVDITLNDVPHFVVKGNNSPIIYVVKEEFRNVFEPKNEMLKTLEMQHPAHGAAAKKPF